MSPRKSSTSSGRPKPPRPRYLGVEAAGLPFLPRAWWETALGRALRSSPTPGDPDPGRLRLVKTEGARALVEVGHLTATAARRAWNAELAGPKGEPVALSTRRTWGTLRDAKRWFRSAPTGDPRSRAPGPRVRTASAPREIRAATEVGRSPAR